MLCHLLMYMCIHLLISFIKIFCFKEFEDRQLLWERHEVELERSIAKLEEQQRDVMEAAQKVFKKFYLLLEKVQRLNNSRSTLSDHRYSVCDHRKASSNSRHDRQYLVLTTTFTNFNFFATSLKTIYAILCIRLKSDSHLPKKYIFYLLQ